MPLTAFQAKLAKTLAVNRSEDSHLAGGAALHLAPNSTRFSNDLDYFNDSEERVAEAFQNDEALLKKKGYKIHIEMRQPGYIRAQVSKDSESTKVEWAFDSAWRFMPAEKNEECGYRLHPIDLATNKVLTLAGRNEPRDFLDILDAHKKILSLGALCWSAVGKDPGFNPRSLLELLKRRGKFHKTDFQRLMLNRELNLEELKSDWLSALAQAETFIESRPPDEAECLYFSLRDKTFYTPAPEDKRGVDYELHFGRPAGILPHYDGE